MSAATDPKSMPTLLRDVGMARRLIGLKSPMTKHGQECPRHLVVRQLTLGTRLVGNILPAPGALPADFFDGLVGFSLRFSDVVTQSGDA